VATTLHHGIILPRKGIQRWTMSIMTTMVTSPSRPGMVRVVNLVMLLITDGQAPDSGSGGHRLVTNAIKKDKAIMGSCLLSQLQGVECSRRMGHQDFF
jgi:hypothetical protein